MIANLYAPVDEDQDDRDLASSFQDQHDKVQDQQNSSSLDVTVESDQETSVTQTPSRRKNLAATVLKYGEEISLKNSEIKRLESEVSTLNIKMNEMDEMKAEMKHLRMDLKNNRWYVEH